MLNWIVWNRTVLTFNCVLTKKNYTYTNWILWNRTVYMYKNRFGINNLQWMVCHKTKPKPNQIKPKSNCGVCNYWLSCLGLSREYNPNYTVLYSCCSSVCHLYSRMYKWFFFNLNENQDTAIIFEVGAVMSVCVCVCANVKNNVFRGWFYLLLNYLLTVSVSVFFLKHHQRSLGWFGLVWFLCLMAYQTLWFI